MSDRDDFRELRDKIEDGTITGAKKEEIEKYAVFLSKNGVADEYFSTDPRQFPQVCETIRMLLLKKYTEEIDRQTTAMQKTNIDLQRKSNELSGQNKKLQIVVIVLMVLTILVAGIQIYVATRPNEQISQGVILLQDIKISLTKTNSVHEAAHHPSAIPQGIVQKKALQQKQMKHTLNK